MNKEEFITFLAAQYDITKKAAEETINMFTSSVIEVIKQKKTVNLVGFGSFYSVDIKSRKGVNPQTREKITIDAYSKPSFRAGQKLKDAANSKGKKA
jgi:DNA-binding protein HU-beta